MCIISILATANKTNASILDALPHLVGMLMVMVVLAVLWGVCAFTARMLQIFIPEPKAVSGPVSKATAIPTAAPKPGATEIKAVPASDVAIHDGQQLRITVEGKIYDVTVGEIGKDASSSRVAPATVVRTAAPAPAIAATPPAAPKPADTGEGAGATLSPLAGIVQAIAATVGASVSAGDLVITLEAMKMYTPINAPVGGTITAIHVKVGDAVEEGQILYTIG